MWLSVCALVNVVVCVRAIVFVCLFLFIDLSDNQIDDYAIQILWILKHSRQLSSQWMSQWTHHIAFRIGVGNILFTTYKNILVKFLYTKLSVLTTCNSTHARTHTHIHSSSYDVCYCVCCACLVVLCASWWHSFTLSAIVYVTFQSRSQQSAFNEIDALTLHLT